VSYITLPYLHNLYFLYHITLFFVLFTLTIDMAAYNESQSMRSQNVLINVEELAEVVRKSSIPPQSIWPVVLPPSALGNPGPLGLGGFALTTFCLSVFNTGVLANGNVATVVLPLALFYGGLAQLIAGIFEYKVPNTFGATAFISYGSFWLSYAYLVSYVAPTFPAATAHEGIGLYLLCWTIFTLYMFVASLRTSRVVTAVFFFLSITFILLTVGTLAQNESTSRAGGWFGLITAFCAWYGSAAVVINSTWEQAVLPVGVYDKSKNIGQFWAFRRPAA